MLIEKGPAAADPGFGGGKRGGGGMVGVGGASPNPARGMGECCKLPHLDLGQSPRSFATLLY